MPSIPLVSIVVPLWRQERHIVACVNSVLAQTHGEIEVVFVDNNASENVLDRVAPYLERKHHIFFRLVHEPTQGIASARSRGVLESRGEYVGFLDSDDLMDPERIALQVASLRKNPSASMAVCLYDFISPDGGKVLTRQWFPRAEMWARVLLGKGADPGTPFYDPHPSTMLFPRKVAIEAGLFDTRFNPFWYEDSEFSLRMHMHGAIQLVNKSLVSIRRTSVEYQKIRQGQVDWVRFKNTDLFFRILASRFDPSDPRFRKAFSRIRSRWLQEQSEAYFDSKGGQQLGRLMLTRAIRENPFNLKAIDHLFRHALFAKEIADGPEIPEEFSSPDFVRFQFLQ